MLMKVEARPSPHLNLPCDSRDYSKKQENV